VAGVAATEWSWGRPSGALNNDGSQKIFISNGLPKRMNE